jgi:hypothetical protein
MKIEVLQGVRNSRVRPQNGFFQDILSQAQKGEPLMVVEHNLTNPTILKLGALGIGILIINHLISKI